MTSNYRRGSDFERKVMDVLRQRGFLCVRSAGSRSPVDVVAWNPAVTLLVQCKADGRMRAADRARLLAWAQDGMALLPVLAAKAGRGTVEFIAIAEDAARDTVIDLENPTWLCERKECRHRTPND